MVGDVAHLARRVEQANNILEKQQQRAEEKEKQQKNNSWKERNREAQMKLKAKILQKKKST